MVKDEGEFIDAFRDNVYPDSGQLLGQRSQPNMMKIDALQKQMLA